mgnify:CR=1 FL=1|jgi:glycosyltransferase involved in cell wall biosynthesis
MKIAFIYDGVYPWITGGIEKRLHELSKKLVERGHEVHWYGVGWWWTDSNKTGAETTKSMEFKQCKVTVVENDGRDIELDGIHIHGVCKPLNLYKNDRRSIKEAIYFAWNLFPILMREKFDIVDCQNFPFFSCFPAKLHALTGRSTLVITWHEVWNSYWYEYLGKKGVFGKMIESLTAHLTENTVAVSKKTEDNLKSINNKLKIELIPNGMNFKGITGAAPSGELSDVIFAGRLIKEKNVDVLVRAINRVRKVIPDVKCLIVGEGPEGDRLRNLVHNLGLDENVKFMKFFDDYSDLISCMKSSKVFVLPSTREGFGIVVVEANACGLPVVTVKSPMNAASDLVTDDKNGFICQLSDECLADKIVKGINNGEKMREDCIKTAERYDWARIVDSLEKFYSKILT